MKMLPIAIIGHSVKNHLLSEGESVQRIDREKGGMNACAGLVQKEKGTKKVLTPYLALQEIHNFAKPLDSTRVSLNLRNYCKIFPHTLQSFSAAL